jgi:hypothetical protein
MQYFRIDFRNAPELMSTQTEKTYKVLWAIAFMLFVSSLYIWYLIESLPAIPVLGVN